MDKVVGSLRRLPLAEGEGEVSIDINLLRSLPPPILANLANPFSINGGKNRWWKFPRGRDAKEKSARLIGEMMMMIGRFNRFDDLNEA